MASVRQSKMENEPIGVVQLGDHTPYVLADPSKASVPDSAVRLLECMLNDKALL